MSQKVNGQEALPMESVEEDPMIQILIEPLNELLERSRSHQNPMESIDETLEAPLTQPI